MEHSSATGTPAYPTWLSPVLHVLGYVSIIASIIAWYLASSSGSPEAVAHGERFGIFIGLWAPTFFILSGRYSSHGR